MVIALVSASILVGLSLGPVAYGGSAQWVLVAQQELPKRTESPSLIVYVLDPVRDPLPGIEVRVKSLSEKGKPTVAYTDKDGYAKFWVKGNGDYSIEAKWPGFKTKRLKKMRLAKPTPTSPTANIQFQMELAGPGTTVY